MKRGGSSSLRPSAAMEKRRRDHMKDLYSKLASLLHLQSYERMPLLALLDQATITLKQWKERVERMTARKQELQNERISGESSHEHKLQVVQVSEMDSSLEVNLIISKADNVRKVELFRVLSIIQQSGAEIVSCSSSCLGHNQHCTIHAQAFHTRLGFDTSLIEYRLKQLIS
ncbi:transcription factor bHLH167-like [Cynara cardunculus var. scolymus]|uniref:Myc-type, basic helix-loop-helix (BHLH) domain-containing protein n=1 Tax=Cynara cardunculus var. scolymus TaxID=59895 RepID=A0A124SG84_CYNCS|nr:transcription factor bHLH167-like [Cynara cardunculus var. scolymus]KVI05598.1 Myc-type, basic helix-loop-helix (bHLH) domain-containing protein [Cynara cardunculus var. scolymus]